MLFLHDQSDGTTPGNARTVRRLLIQILVYQNGKADQQPIEAKIVRKKTTINELGKILKIKNLRLFNTDGAEIFQEDIDFVKNGTVLYASRGEDFDPSSCYAEYQILKLLGEGGFGKVYLAQHKLTKVKYAMKIIKTEKIGSVADIDSIFVEAQILKSLKHPNIVQVFKCLALKNMQVVIIMEYLAGGELLKFVQDQKCLTEEVAKGYIKQIVKGMVYCHQKNLIHRDLKLENLLIADQQNKKTIKIIDFGIAGAISFMKCQNMDSGSLGYMAPECFSHQKNTKIDGRIDVWSTGVILYAMLVGRLPFAGETGADTIQLIKAGKYSIPASIEKNLSGAYLDVLSRCLQPNLKSRITMEELNDHPWFSGTHAAIKAVHYYEKNIILQVPERENLKEIQNKPRKEENAHKAVSKKNMHSPQPKRTNLLEAKKAK